MPCLPSINSKPAVVDNYSQRLEEQDEQLARALRAEERHDDELQLALALSASLIEEELLSSNEKNAISLAEALSLSETSTVENTTSGMIHEHLDSKIQDDEFKDIGDASKVSNLNDHHIV